MDENLHVTPHVRAGSSREEVWGLLMPDTRILLQGYSQRTLTSREDVEKDFDSAVVALGEPVVVKRVSTMTETFSYTVDD